MHVTLLTSMPAPSLIALLALAAFGAGLIDSIAGGGGMISLPSLLAAGVPPHLALGTNKGQAVFGATASAISFWRRGLVDRPRALPGFVAGFAGALVGAHIVLGVSPATLRVAVIVLLLGASIVVLTRRGAAALMPKVTGPVAARAALIAICFALGAYDGFFGPGTGSLLVIAFATVFGDALTRASGNAKIVNLASNLAAMLLFASRGTILWRVSLPMAAANALGATVGARLAIRRGDGLVRGVVLLVVLAVVAKLSIDLSG